MYGGKNRQLDLPTLLIPDEFDGSGQSGFCCALVLDALAFECAGIASIFAHHFAACIPVIKATKTQRDQLSLSSVNGTTEKLQ